jgi:hypothetical protein
MLPKFILDNAYSFYFNINIAIIHINRSRTKMTAQKEYNNYGEELEKLLVLRTSPIDVDCVFGIVLFLQICNNTGRDFVDF